MACEFVQMPNGARAIVCSSTRRPRCECGQPAPLACDWKVADRRSGTCDAPICRECATSPAPEKDLCPEHAAEFQLWKARRQARAERNTGETA